MQHSISQDNTSSDAKLTRVLLFQLRLVSLSIRPW